ncbi:GNAT family N-acetyltransferase [Sphingomonas sp.]|jgi:CelD/BcsL family acetyltransferase involved in cellulose biosynthesis|uniref:GNAT family N-acetyltransferase n=1 Tax=Sphingomonas sp. TaxID=28214 RepID=UPI002D808B0F|nr:GNAT family N-acetyltransferase [Sphingomonas sp.]HEU0044041.1 GNAT family N-acetyltransferase [Sphingomonas sp.]
MTAPLPLAAFDRLPPVARAEVVEGLDSRLDTVAGRAAEGHRFLRCGWFAAALTAYGGEARTLVASEDEVAVLALPFVGIGPAALKLATIPGSYWPFRGFPLALGAGEPALKLALAALARQVRGLRVGPIPDGDAAAEPLLVAARAAGWTVIDRAVARSWRFDLTDPEWPRSSTLKKNRFFEKHLAGHGVLDWRFLDAADWPDGFDLLAKVEEASWIAADTDGRDAKFTAGGHGAFWRAAVADPVLAQCFHAALLTVDGAPAAFSFDMDVGTERYAIANSYRPDIAKHSPGRLLHYRNLARARDAGVRSVDWGAGDSGYKRTLGAVEGPMLRDWLLLRPGLPALAGSMLARWWRQSGAKE